jgi:outer membrane receptor protein involved in Fe transport
LTGELDLDTWGKIITDFSYRNRDNESEVHYVDFFTGLPAVGEQKSEIPTFGFLPRWVWERDLWRFHNKLIAGFDYYWSDSKVIGHDSVNGDPSRGFLSDTADIERQTWALYFHNDFSMLKNLIFSCGYRYEEIENDFKGKSWTLDWITMTYFWQSFQDEQDDAMNAWDVGLTYLFLENSKVYGRISKSYRYPAIDEYFSVWSGLNPLLKPQEGITYEVGVDHYFTDTIRSGLTFFWMELEDEIYLDQLTYTSKNYDDTRRLGVEIFAEGKPWDWLRLWANYTYIKATFRGGAYKGNDVPGVPNHKVSFGLDLTPAFVACLEGLEFNVWATYVSEQRFISDQPNVVPKLDDYISVNAKLSYTWRFLRAFVGVNNIFDEEYSEYGICSQTTGARNYYPSPGVNVVGGMSITF